MRKITFIVNPITKYRNRFDREEVETFFEGVCNISLDFKITQFPGQEVFFAKEAVKEEVDTLVVVGGGGTVLNVIQELVYTNVKLYIMPTGVTNGFCDHFRYPQGLLETLHAIVENQYESIDLGKVIDSENKSKYFLSYFCAGITGHMVNSTPEKKKKSLLYIYFWAVIAAFSFKAKKIKLRLDTSQQIFHFKTYELFVGNVSTYGGYLDEYVGTSVKDGLFEVSIGNVGSWMGYISIVLGHFFVERAGIEKINTVLKERKLFVDVQEGTKMQMDWEKVSFSNQLVVKACPNALKLIQPVNIEII